MKKKPSRLLHTLVVCLGLAVLAACSAKAEDHRVQWHGLCIPAGKASHLSSGSPFGKMLSQVPMDKTEGGAVTITFSPEDMMRAIPGWTGYVPARFGGPKLRNILVANLLLNTPVNAGRLTNSLRQMYSLKGAYAHAKIAELGDSGLYRIQKANERWGWSLLLVDPRSNDKPPVEDVSDWYAGECGGQGQDTGCDLGFAKGDFAFAFDIGTPNIKYTREVEHFLVTKVREWRAACKTDK